jgi:asparagine synthetase B (glutamine-hydrolysing)
MLQTLRLKDADSSDRQVGLRCALGGTSFPGELSMAGDQDIWLAATGLVHPAGELAARLQHDGIPLPEPLSFAGLLLALYRRYGVQGICGLNGSYTVAVWEELPRRLTIVTDPLGTANLYYWRTTGRLVFASEYKAIAWHPKLRLSLDPAALVDLFVYEESMLDRTFFSDIRCLPPAAVLVWEDGQVSINSYWGLPVYQPGDAGSPADWEAALAEGIRTAVRRQVRPNTLLLLTGGLDSRLLAESYRDAEPGLPVHAATVGSDNCRDGVIAQQIAAALGIPYTRIKLDEAYLAHYAATASWRAEGKLNAFASWIYSVESFMLDHGWQYAMTGLIGNVISGRHYPPGLAAAHSVPEAEEVIWREMIKPPLDKLETVMRPSVYRTAAEESASVYLDTFRRMDAPDLLNRFDHMYLYTVISRLAQKTDVFGAAGFGLDPFMDLDLLHTALSMPPQARAGGRLYKQMIVDHFPVSASIIHERSGLRLAEELERSQDNLAGRLLNFQRRVERRLSSTSERQSRYRCIRQNEAIRTGSRKFVLSVLSQEQYLEDIFDISAVRRVVMEHMERRRNEYSLIAGLVTIVLWRQQFTDRRSPAYAYPSGQTGPLSLP